MATRYNQTRRFDPYDPDFLEIREEIAQLRRRAGRAGRTVEEQKVVDAERQAAHDAEFAEMMRQRRAAEQPYSYFDKRDPWPHDRRGRLYDDPAYDWS